MSEPDTNEKTDRRDWWCWIQDDPEMTYPDPGEWADDLYPGDTPVLQRFNWGRPAPSTWAVVYYDADEDRCVKQFDSEYEARTFLEGLPA